MVAVQFAPGRAAAVAIAAVMLLTIIPMPTAQAQLTTAADVFLVQGEAAFYQRAFDSARSPTAFITNDNPFTTLRVPVHQSGSSALTDIPVYYRFIGVIDGSEFPSRAGCVTVNIPAPGPGQTQNSTNASFEVRTDDLALGGYRLEISALRNPWATEPGNTGGAPPCGGNVRRPCDEVTGTVPQGCVTETDAVGVENNVAFAYFVKHAFIDPVIDTVRWCAGSPDIVSERLNATTGLPEGTDSSPSACNDDMIVDDQPWNVTVQSGTRNTFFEVVVKNTGNWTDLSNYGGPCGCRDDRWEYGLNITLTGNFTNATYLSRRTSFAYKPIDNGHEGHSAAWNITNLTGRYNVTVKVDPAKELRYPNNPASVHIAQRHADVLYRDYTGNITFAGQGASPSNPYPYDGPFTIAGAFTFRNIGTADGLPITPTTRVNYTIYIDNRTNSIHNVSSELAETDAGDVAVVHFAFDVTSDGTSQRYLPPGKHTIYGAVDSDNTTLELNESNNNISVEIYVADDTVPRFNDTKIAPAGLLGIGAPAKNEYRPHEPFNIFANVSDDDAGLTVVANLTLDSDPSVNRTYNLTKSGQWYVVQLATFDFHNFSNRSTDGSEMWTVTLRANDSSDNNITATPTQKLKLVPWPIHTVPLKDILMAPTDHPNETVVPWDGDQQPQWKIRVLPNWTGFDGNPNFATRPCPCQQNFTENLAYNITTAKGRTFDHNGSYWHPETPWETGSPCRAKPPANGDDVLANLPADGCDPALNNTFTASFSKTQEGAGPGRWNYSVRVADFAGHARVINGTILIEDKPPAINELNISTDHVSPGQNFTVLLNVSDDDDTIASAHVHFQRTRPGDGKSVNLTLTKFEEEAAASVTYFVYNETFKVGRNEVFGLGGTFNVTIAVSDLTGNWNTSNLGNFTLTDEDAPTLTSYGVFPNVAQVGENVTFYAKVSDSTNTSVRLELFRTTTSSELLIDAIMLNESADGNFTATLNITGEGVHAWRLTPIDSVNTVGAFGEGLLTVRDNLGPRFEVRSPGAVVDGVRYGSGKPRLDVVIFDVEGVIASSIDVKVAGLAVDYTIAPAPGNLNGFLVTYQVPASKKFSHNDVVAVNVTAEDNSTERLLSFLNFTFTVDDVAPVAKLASIAPSYRDQPAHVLNISLNSRFTLGADDNDGLPTDIESIRYRILGGGPSAETVYSGPFKINDAPGVYTGPRLYQIQFWAEDVVGNLNPTFNVTTVYVDDTPPALFQFFPQGRLINASFVDDRVGVNRSVVWYHENAEPYVPLPLVEKDGAWSLTLPEGVKGDRVSYYLQAWDRLDNTETFGNATAPYASFSVDNHEPKVRITNPVDGSRIFRTVELTWDASDEDGDALVFTLYYKAPGRANFVELAKIENSASRRYTLDSTRFPDGQYTFRVAAGDGGFVKLAETTVTILNRASAVGVVNVEGAGIPGDTMLIKAEITKAEAIVEARLYLDGDLVGSYPMNDENRDGDEVANDGIYSVRVPIEIAGDYSVEIFTQYREDGELKESSVSDAATFSAKLTPGYLLTEYGAVIAVIGLLAAVGIGVAVFVVMRRR